MGSAPSPSHLPLPPTLSAPGVFPHLLPVCTQTLGLPDRHAHGGPGDPLHSERLDREFDGAFGSQVAWERRGPPSGLGWAPQSHTLDSGNDALGLWARTVVTAYGDGGGAEVAKELPPAPRVRCQCAHLRNELTPTRPEFS